MLGMITVFWKELADHFSSWRFIILFTIVFAVGILAIYLDAQYIREAVSDARFVFLQLYTTSGQALPLFILFSAFFMQVLGITLGFDAINSEKNSGTMSRLLAQPIYRDAVINGKFLAGVFTLTLMVTTTVLLVSGYGLRMIGVPPTAEEIIRLFIYFVITVIYGAFWMALAMLFSVLFRRAAGSLLIPIVLFIFLFFFWMFLGLGPAIANSIAPVDSNSQLELQIRNLELQETLLRLSPSYLFQEAFFYLLNPVMMGMGVITMEQASFVIPNPLSLGQTLLAVWPHIVGLISLSVVFFAISYIVFMKQEIRAT